MTNTGVPCTVNVATSRLCAIDCMAPAGVPVWQYTIYPGSPDMLYVIEAATTSDSGLAYCNTHGQGSATPL